MDFVLVPFVHSTCGAALHGTHLPNTCPQHALGMQWVVADLELTGEGGVLERRTGLKITGQPARTIAMFLLCPKKIRNDRPIFGDT